MRTTLKRAIGRAAAFDGNGRAVLPPGLVEPIRRYRQPEPPPRSTGRLAATVFGWILLVLLVVASGIGGGLYLYAHETLNAIAPHSLRLKITQRDLAKLPSPSAAATALLIGYDARAGIDAFGASASRSDTMMLIRADPQQNTLSMLSLPRDLVVPIYCTPSSPLATDRINSAWARCGPRGSLDTVEKLTGIAVNYLITVDFHGFKLLVNKLNGIYVDVDHRYLNMHGGPSGYATLDLEPGYQKLNGQQALDFVRFRHTDSDLYRVARQQLFIQALKDRLASGFSIFDIPSLIGAMKGNVAVVRAAGGAVGLSEIESYAGLAYKLPPGHLFRDSIQNVQPYGPYNAELVAAPGDVQTAVNAFEHPDVTLAARADAVALGKRPPAPRQHALKPAQISTLVLNGTTIAGLARDTSYKLTQAGFATVGLPPTMLANAPSQGYHSSYVYYDAVQPNSRRAAAELQQVFGAHTLVAAMPPEIAPFAQQAGNPLTVVVVGSGFGGQLSDPQAHIAPAPAHKQAAVRTDPGLTLARLQQAQRQLPFRVLVPRLVERSSGLADLSPVRVYPPEPRKHAVVLTFVTGASNVYWQIEETDWTSAPILRRPTAQVHLGGRLFDLYTTGGNIHIVVLHYRGASYWVVNTLRDELSNETMLAIANGLQPLGK
jgi:LCP family protein required for cell wall assembly